MERSKQETETESKRDSSESGSGNTSKRQRMLRKTFKQPASEADSDQEEVLDYKNLNDKSCEVKIEPSSQIEKSKKTVRHFEELIRNKNIENEAFNGSNNNNNKNFVNETAKDENINDELSKKLQDLAENEKKLE